MKSNKQRRAEILSRRLERATQIEAQVRTLGKGVALLVGAAGLVPADVSVLERHNNTCGWLPTYYLDRVFTCHDCGIGAVWTAKQQKWWYEVVHGSIESQAVRCLACRRARRAARTPSHQGEGANLLGEMSLRLRALAESAPTPRDRAEVDAAMVSKWWGLRVLAIQALGRWGRDADMARLRALVDARQPSWNTWEYQGADEAAEALAEKLCHPGDDGWALEACLQGHARPWVWRDFLIGVPAERLSVCAEEVFGHREGDWHRLSRLLAVLHCVGRTPSPAQMAVVRAHAQSEVRQWDRHFPSKVEWAKRSD